jgi:Leucine-rich repeat (LRR) protein
MPVTSSTVLLPPLRSAFPPVAWALDRVGERPIQSWAGDARRLVSGSRYRVKPRLLADLVQNVAEYASASISDLMSLRGVSREFKSAVSDAVGFLNGRCWTALEARDNLREAESLLWALRRRDEIVSTNRCALVCLRHRLETLHWRVGLLRTKDGRDANHLPLELFGDDNTVLATLVVHGRCIDADKLRCLRGLQSLCARGLPDLAVLGDLPALESLELTGVEDGDLSDLRRCAALTELRLRGAGVTHESLVGLEPMLCRLVKLDLKECAFLEAVSNLAACTALRELDLSYTGVTAIRDLQRLPALEMLDLRGTTVRDTHVLQHCARLCAVSVNGDRKTGACAVPADVLIRCATHLDLSRSRTPDLHIVGRCKVLRVLDLSMTATNDGDVCLLASIKTLETLHLMDTSVTEVSPLRDLPALRELDLTSTQVTDEGISALCDIVTLEKLTLSNCRNVTCVTNLGRCVALRELNLASSFVTDSGIEGLERIPTLTKLRLFSCAGITTVVRLRHCACLRELDISLTMVTAAGIVGLEAILTLESLKMDRCCALNDVTSLRECRALRHVSVCGTNMDDACVAALGKIATLTSLCMSRCKGVRDVSSLGSLSRLAVLELDGSGIRDVTPLQRCPLRRLTASGTAVTDAGIAGIESWAMLEPTSCSRLRASVDRDRLA